MRTVVQAISWLALIGTLLPSVLFLQGSMDLDPAKRVMLAATIAWFVATPLWMGRKPQQAA